MHLFKDIKAFNSPGIIYEYIPLQRFGSSIPESGTWYLAPMGQSKDKYVIKWAEGHSACKCCLFCVTHPHHRFQSNGFWFCFVLFFFLMKTFAVALGYWAPVDKYRWVNYEVTRAKLKHLPANWIQQTASLLSHQLLYANLFCIF